MKAEKLDKLRDLLWELYTELKQSSILPEVRTSIGNLGGILYTKDIAEKIRELNEINYETLDILGRL